MGEGKISEEKRKGITEECKSERWNDKEIKSMNSNDNSHKDISSRKIVRLSFAHTVTTSTPKTRITHLTHQHQRVDSM